MNLVDFVQSATSWSALLLAIGVFGFAPGFVVRLLVFGYDRKNPRRQELVAELYAVPRWKRPMWVAQQLETVLFEGLGPRVKKALTRRKSPKVGIIEPIRVRIGPWHVEEYALRRIATKLVETVLTLTLEFQTTPIAQHLYRSVQRMAHAMTTVEDPKPMIDAIAQVLVDALDVNLRVGHEAPVQPQERLVWQAVCHLGLVYERDRLQILETANERTNRRP